ncbi:hypothetical protein [Streptomyces sp. NPDC002990]
MDNQLRDENTDKPCSVGTDEELAWRAAALATAWVCPGTPLSQRQGWDLVGLQHMGSAQGETYAWGRVLKWERRLAEALTCAEVPTVDDDAGGVMSRHRLAEARRVATSAMRDMLLAGIASGEQTNQIWRNGSGPDPREELRAFIASHGG